MSQKSSLPQPAKSDSLVLIPDNWVLTLVSRANRRRLELAIAHNELPPVFLDSDLSNLRQS